MQVFLLLHIGEGDFRKVINTLQVASSRLTQQDNLIDEQKITSLLDKPHKNHIQSILQCLLNKSLKEAYECSSLFYICNI